MICIRRTGTSFRRFRISHLREARIHEDVIRYWAGHANGSITDLYSKLGEKIELRKQAATAAGLGFDLQALGSPKRERKRQTRIERMFKNQSVAPTSYKAIDEDLPQILFAKEVCVG